MKYADKTKSELTRLVLKGEMWTDDEDILVSLLGAELIRKHIQISGFGGVAYTKKRIAGGSPFLM